MYAINLLNSLRKLKERLRKYGRYETFNNLNANWEN